MDGIKGSGLYRIEIVETLDGSWSDWFEGLSVENGPNGSTLRGRLRDRAELYGTLQRISDLGLTLRHLEYTEETKEKDR